MLKGISPLVGPDLLATLSRMGHGDEIVLADAHFPADSVHARVLRADGVMIADLLDGILPLFELDDYVPDRLVMMSAGEGDTLDPAVGARYRAAIERHCHSAPATTLIPRFDFYARARKAFAVVLTGELAKYGNIILKKGVTPTRAARP
jgi:L-fucose mutarotase